MSELIDERIIFLSEINNYDKKLEKLEVTNKKLSKELDKKNAEEKSSVSVNEKIERIIFCIEIILFTIALSIISSAIYFFNSPFENETVTV